MNQISSPPVVSIVAKSGTGKTTFMEKLIPELKQFGLTIGVIKHHSHPTPFDIPGKDTYRHFEAGADRVIGASGVQIAVFHRQEKTIDPEVLIAEHLADLDLVLTEGFKRGPYPKIEIHRAARSSSLLCTSDELLALVTDESFDLNVPQFELDDAKRVAVFLHAWLEKSRYSDD